MEESLDFAPLVLVLFLAFAVPMMLGRLRWLPTVVGEILAGIIIGHSGLNLVGENATLEVFSNIGLAFLMFLAGLEIDFDRLFPARERQSNKTPPENATPNLLLYALVVYILTLALALPAGALLNRLGLQGDPWLLAFILGATSLGVLLPILKARGLTHTLVGQAIFFSALLADFITVILLTIFLIIQHQGLDVQIFSIGLLFLAFFIAQRILTRFFGMKRVRALIEELSQVTVQIKVRGALAILMGFVVLASLLGVELILGAFLAGMIISLIRTPEDIDLIHKLEAFGYGFFIPIFFILVGVNLELGTLFSSPRSLALLPMLLVVALLVKALPTLVLRRLLPWRETLAGAFLLTTHLSLEIAVAVIGVRLHLLDQATGTALILFSLITVLLMPIFANGLLPASTPREKRWMVIFGADDLGLQVARELKGHSELVRFLEMDSQLAENARRAGFETYYSETIGDCLEEVSKAHVQALLVLSVNDDRNLQVCKAASCQGIDHIVALVNNPALLPEYRSLGVNPFTPALYRPSLLAVLARSPDIFRLLTCTSDDQDVREIQVLNPEVDNQRVRTLGLPGNLLVLSINRDGEIIIPHGNTRLKYGDRLTTLGAVSELAQALNWLEDRPN
ncbi:MAG: cation:proton antiporter [Chloroflexota bacterium]